MLLRRLLLEDQEGRLIIEFCKKINIKDMGNMSPAAWDDIPTETLTRSWCKLLQTDNGTTASSTDHVEDDSSVESNCEALLHELDSNLWT